MMISPSRQRSIAVRLTALAERNPRRAGQYALHVLSRPGLSGTELFAAGWALLRWERLTDAVAALSAAEAKLPPHEGMSRLRCRRALLMAHQQDGAGQSLQAFWEAHVQACKAADAQGELARARCEQIAHLNLLGRPAEARALAVQISTLVTQHGTTADVARHQYVAGVATVGCADLYTAQRQLDRAYDLFARLRIPAEVARVCIERAWLWLRREQLDHAEADLIHALALCEQLDLPLRAALCQRDLGVIARYRGEYGQAVARFVAARDQFVALGRPDRAASCDFNLGTVAHMSGLFDLSLAAYRQAQDVFETVGDHFHALVAGRNQALVLCAQGAPAEGLALIDSLIPYQEAAGDPLGLTELRVARAHALSGIGRLDEATSELHAAHQCFLTLGNDPASAECLLELAWLLLDQHAHAAAVTYLRTAAVALDQRPAHNWRVRYGLGRAAEGLGDRAVARGHYAAAVAIVAGLRRQLASEHASSRIYTLARRLYQDALRLAEAQGDIEQVLTLADAQHGLVFDQQLRAATVGAAAPERRGNVAARLRASLRGDATADSIEQALAAYIALLLRERHRVDPIPASDEPLDLDTVRHRLTAAYGENWTVLCPVFSDDALLLAGLTPEGTKLLREPLAPTLRQLIERASQPSYRLHMYQDLTHLDISMRPSWEALVALGHCLLPGWLRARLTPEHRLLIVPSGPLHMLPWAALRLDSGWLCECAIVELIPTLAQAPGASVPAIAAPALLVGCDTFGERAAPLPGALSSLDLVASLWPGEVDRFAGPAATVAAIQSQNQHAGLRRYQLIHLASHAQLGGADGLLAHVKLADADLFLDDILQLRLDGALVVLAACEGGAGAVLPGDEVLGLSRALLAAGAGSVLANLWPIHDRGILAFLAPFYRAFTAGADAAAALAAAQRALINGPLDDAATNAIMRTPLIWGSFTVTSRRVTVP